MYGSWKIVSVYKKRNLVILLQILQDKKNKKRNVNLVWVYANKYTNVKSKSPVTNPHLKPSNLLIAAFSRAAVEFFGNFQPRVWAALEKNEQILERENMYNDNVVRSAWSDYLISSSLPSPPILYLR